MRLDVDQIRPLVERWLPSQRWFSGKGRDAKVDAELFASLADATPSITIWTATVSYADGGREVYQLPLVIRDMPVGTLEHVLLGSVIVEDAVFWVYDALHDKDVTQVWLEAIRDERAEAALSFQRFVAADDIPVGQYSLVLTAEQSNTSLVYGDSAILKVFRRLEQGINPDIEVHQALARFGSKHVARLLGSVTAQLDDQPASLAMLQEFLTTGTDGWELAKTSVRDLIAEGDLHPADAGGDFAGEAERLGAAVASVHTDLAEAFGTDVLTGADLAARGAAMHARLDTALGIVPDLAPHEEALRGLYDAFLADQRPLVTQRVHGDLHLGQVMRTVRRWVVLDFEGEPVSSIASRRAFDSPLRDVAGMLRSFDYASRHQITDIPHSPQLAYRAAEWSDRNRGAFCDGYAEAAHSDPRQDGRLRAFEADKAVYEAVYEARHRPSWLGIPLASLTRLGKSTSAEGLP
jgi:maltokinase